jgi:hypothetical protein
LGNLILLSTVSLSVLVSGNANALFGGGSRSLLTYWLQIAFVAIYMGIPIYCLASLIKLIKSMVFQDTKYLLLSLPRRSYSIFGGTFLTVLLEFALYAVCMFFWLSLIAAVPGGTKDYFFAVLKTGSFLGTLKAIYYFIFIKRFSALIQIVTIMLIYGTYVAMVFNFSFSLFAALFKHKKFPKILTIVFIYFVFDISVRSLLALSSIGRASIWVPAGITGLLAIGFFVGTCYLFEKKIEG